MPQGAGDCEETGEGLVVSNGEPVLVGGQRVVDWLNPEPVSSSVRLRMSIEAMVVAMDSRATVALRPIVVVLTLTVV